MTATLQQASGFLDALVTGLYHRSASADVSPPLASLPLIPTLDDPVAARQVLAHPDVFVKNYAFFEDLGRGRFSSNGTEWRQRAALTQPAYRVAHQAVSPDLAREVYARHLLHGAALDADALFSRFIAAAVEIFSRAIGLSHALAWPDELVAKVRDLLKIRQWIDWNGCSPEFLQQVQHEIAEQRAAIEQCWRGSAEGQSLLAALGNQGSSIDGFDAAQELIQNLIASSETTASSLLWAVEVLSQKPALQAQLRADAGGLDGFIDELLRLFPPVPYLTRRCVVAHDVAGMSFVPGNVLSISIVGIHRHPHYWSSPTRFDSRRAEFAAAATPLAYMPFSRGQRVCAGMKLARVELRAGLEAFLALRRCSPGATPTEFEYGLSCRPRTSLRAERAA